MEINHYFAAAAAFVAVIGFLLSFRWPLLLLGGHLLSRFVLDSMSAFTYLDTVPGLSFAKLYSIGTIGVLLLYVLIKRQKITSPLFLAVGALICCYAISAFLNSYWSGFFVEGAKWMYLFVLTALTQHCIEKSGLFKTSLVYWTSLLFVLANQLHVGLTHGAEYSAGQSSYYGSYGHESDVSFMLLLFICVAIMLTLLSQRLALRSVFAASAVYGHIAIVLCNYRTSLIALGFVWLFLFYGWLRRNSVAVNSVLLPALAVVFVVFVISFGLAFAEKMNDIVVILANPSKYFDFSGHARHSSLLSGRLDLWNEYIYLYLNTDVLGALVGIGPSKGAMVVGVYAHNEYISALTETGIFGVIAFAFVVYYFIRLSAKALVSSSVSLVAVAPVIIGVLVMALGTMPFRNVRAMILLAYCCAVLYSRVTETRGARNVSVTKQRYEAAISR